MQPSRSLIRLAGPLRGTLGITRHDDCSNGTGPTAASSSNTLERRPPANGDPMALEPATDGFFGHTLVWRCYCVCRRKYCFPIFSNPGRSSHQPEHRYDKYYFADRLSILALLSGILLGRKDFRGRQLVAYTHRFADGAASCCGRHRPVVGLWTAWHLWAIFGDCGHSYRLYPNRRDLGPTFCRLALLCQSGGDRL